MVTGLVLIQDGFERIEKEHMSDFFSCSLDNLVTFYIVSENILDFPLHSFLKIFNNIIIIIFSTWAHRDPLAIFLSYISVVCVARTKISVMFKKFTNFLSRLYFLDMNDRRGRLQ